MRKGGKTIFVIAGVIVFITGIIIGSFLVLRSASSEGKLYKITNPEEQSTQDLLEDLRTISELPAEQNPKEIGKENITKNFLETIAREGDYQELDSAEYAQDKFLNTTVFPYFTKNQEGIFPTVTATNIIISPSTDTNQYITKIKERLVFVVGAWQKIIQLDPEIINTLSTKEDFKILGQILSLNDEALHELEVPEDFTGFHKNVLQISSDVQVIVASIVEKEQDPLRAFLVMASLEDIGRFGEEVIEELIILENIPNR